MFFQNHPFSSLCAISAIFLIACASPKAPTGGLADELPPKIIAEESTPNQQTNFTEDKITITFDEWFTIKDVATQLVVSPLMPVAPEVKQKGKSIVITLPDSLSENTTYTLNFGSSIADLNEGNVLENFAFVFSTGDVLDSVKMSGKVTNAVTLLPAENIWVMLYPIGEDSAVYKRKPEYVAKTDKEGKWAMANIRADSFNVAALKDDNLNFLYDQESELFGWIDFTIYTLRPIAILPQIFIFPKERRPAISTVVHSVPGWIKVVVDAPLPKPIPTLNPVIENAVTSWTGDTLNIWYNPDIIYTGEALLNNDTTKIRGATGASQVSTKLKVNVLTGRIHPQAPARFSTSVPFVMLDTSLVLLDHDSLGSMPYRFERDSIDQRIFSISANWIPLSRHNFTILPGALHDVWGRVNDTIRHSIVANGADQFGDITLQVEGLDSTLAYILHIKSGEQIVGTYLISEQQTTQIKKGGMAPGKYTIELIEDLNRNRVWDTGHYPLRRQPERKLIFTPDNLRAAWELEAKITWQ